MSKAYSAREMQEWQDARRAAFVQNVLSAFTDQPQELLSFEEVRQKLNLCNARYLGLRDVPLDQIVGSVGRYQDFTRAFFPRRDDLQERWQRVDHLVTHGGGLPPVDLYKVGEAYFVRDGHHRVSVARAHEAPTIQAHVWEYETRVPLEPDTTIEELIQKSARTEFLRRTSLDRLCEDVRIELTELDGYQDLLQEIEAFQQTIARIDERRVPFEEAVTLWCEMVYTPIVEIIRQRGILEEFPERTEADLYLWLRRNQEELDVRYGHPVQMEDAVADLADRFGQKPSPARQVRRAVGRLAENVGELGGRMVESIAPDSGTPEQEQQAAALLDAVWSRANATPLYRFQEDAEPSWEAWRGEFRRRLWDLLGVGAYPHVPDDAAALQPYLGERVQVDGLWRELVWIHTEPNLRVPLYLFRPVEQDAPQPAVLVFPGHGTIAQTAGLERSYQRANALALARAGFVVLTMELRGFGLLDAIGHLRIDASARLVGRTWYGLLVHDAMRAVDYLLTREEVDGERVGATGIGAGGALTMYTAALDERVGVALVNSYLGKYSVTCMREEHCPCNDIPGILRYAEMGDVAGLIAPRPLLFVNGQRDPATTHAAHESFAVVERVYRSRGVPRRAKLIEPERMGHTFDNELAASWFRRWLAAG
jgi:dienelactone hydrolase